MIPYTTIPFFSAFFLVLVGVLIGHLIWYRFRDEQERQTDHLLSKNSRLKSAFENQAVDYERMERDWHQAKDELAELRQHAQALEHQTEQLIQERDRADDQLTQERQTRQDLEVCLHDEQEKLTRSNSVTEEVRQQLQAEQTLREQQSQQLTEAEQQLLDAVQLNRERRQEREQLEQRLADAFAKQEQLASEVRLAESTKEKIHAELTSQKESYARLHKAHQNLTRQLSDNKTQLERQEVGVRQLQSRLDEGESEHATIVDQLKSAHAERDVAQQEVEQLNRKISETEEVAARASTEIEALRAQLARFELSQDELRDESSMHARQAQELTKRLADVETQRGRIQEQLVAAEGHGRRLEAELRDERNHHTALQQSHEDTQQQHGVLFVATVLSLLANEQSARDMADKYSQRSIDLEHSVNTAYQSICELESQLARLESIEEQFLQKGAELRLLKQESKDLRHQRDQALSAESAVTTVVASLRDELNDCLDSVESLRSEAQAAEDRYRSERMQREELQQEISHLHATLAETRESLGASQLERENLEAKFRERADQSRELDDELAHWKRVAADHEQRTGIAEKRLDELAQELDRQQQMTKRTRRRRFVSLENAASDVAAPLSFRELRFKELARLQEDEDKLRTDSELGAVFEEPPRQRDDLTKIPSVDAALERSLNELGIFTFRQIMAWDARVMNIVGERLAIGNNVRRNDWVGHARRLYHDDHRSIA